MTPPLKQCCATHKMLLDGKVNIVPGGGGVQEIALAITEDGGVKVSKNY